MAAGNHPTLHVLVGPNGAGKTTLYERRIAKHYPNAEFVNADELAKQRYGHAARTLEETRAGQRLAEERRRTLIAERKSLVTESTFSHPSKLDLVRDAQAAGYRVVLYHVNVRSANLSVDRVAFRVHQGGHPVPEDKIRGRYERNQQLIHQAAAMADRAYVFDNSKMGKPYTLAIELRHGHVVGIGQNIPKWARELYGVELQRHSAARQNRPATSFAEAQKLVRDQLGEQARTLIARPGGLYTGAVIGETNLHTLQQIAPDAVVAHFTRRLHTRLKMGERVVVAYGQAGDAKVRPTVARGPHAAVADAWRRDPAEATRRYPEHAKALATASAMLEAGRAELARRGYGRREATTVMAKLQRRIADDLEHGRTPPAVGRKRRSPGRESTR